MFDNRYKEPANAAKLALFLIRKLLKDVKLKFNKFNRTFVH